MDEETGVLQEYKNSADIQNTETWQHSYGNKMGKLAHGMSERVQGTNTIIFIKKSEVSQSR